jgi:hypothetical protein
MHANHARQPCMPAMHTRAAAQDQDTVRAHVALAAVKLVRILPEASERRELPRVLQMVANLLAQRLQSTRDGARAVLVDIVQELRAPCLPMVARVLEAALPARGFTAHVLGYTLHACLQVRTWPPSACMPARPVPLPHTCSCRHWLTRVARLERWTIAWRSCCR